jgi:hypothetical protein
MTMMRSVRKLIRIRLDAMRHPGLRSAASHVLVSVPASIMRSAEASHGGIVNRTALECPKRGLKIL